jgi:hypothetical protein
MDEPLDCPKCGWILRDVFYIRKIPYIACLNGHQYARIDGEWVLDSEVLIESKT